MHIKILTNEQYKFHFWTWVLFLSVFFVAWWFLCWNYFKWFGYFWKGLSSMCTHLNYYFPALHCICLQPWWWPFRPTWCISSWLPCSGHCCSRRLLRNDLVDASWMHSLLRKSITKELSEIIFVTSEGTTI